MLLHDTVDGFHHKAIERVLLGFRQRENLVPPTREPCSSAGATRFQANFSQLSCQAEDFHTVLCWLICYAILFIVTAWHIFFNASYLSPVKKLIISDSVGKMSHLNLEQNLPFLQDAHGSPVVTRSRKALWSRPIFVNETSKAWKVNLLRVSKADLKNSANAACN